MGSATFDDTTTQPPESPQSGTNANMLRATPTHQILSALFTSLRHDPRPWTLTRTLHSDNPMDIKGELNGTATFTSLVRDVDDAQGRQWDILYREEGEMPNTVVGMVGLRWSKKYIWRLGEEGKMSVWFVKVGGGSGKRNGAGNGDEEADYLFHEFDFNTTEGTTESQVGDRKAVFVTAPTPPVAANVRDTTILTARGNHLCINDMYRTAYAFRVLPETGEVLSWSSRHVVEGPKKDQDIVNIYQREDSTSA